MTSSDLPNEKVLQEIKDALDKSKLTIPNYPKGGFDFGKGKDRTTVVKFENGVYEELSEITPEMKSKLLKRQYITRTPEGTEGWFSKMFKEELLRTPKERFERNFLTKPKD